MTKRPAVIDASPEQAAAAAPGLSSFVAANAGSGKTRVLVNRVIRLLLNGTTPERILCLTYTKAAAAEMATRLYKTLADWIPLSDDDLIETIHKSTGHARLRADQLAKARRLFAQAIETPGGLKVQTIHAFCEQLLHRFPLEAGIAGDFVVMDDDQTQAARSAVISGLVARPPDDQDYATHLSGLINIMTSQDRFESVLGRVLAHTRAYEAALANIDGCLSELRAELEIDANLTRQGITREALNQMRAAGIERAAQTLERHGNTKAEGLSRALAIPSPQQAFTQLHPFFLTKSYKPVADKTLLAGKIAKSDPDCLTSMQQCREIYATSAARLDRLDIYETNVNLLHIAGVVLRRYRAYKQTNGLFDFDDLIARVLKLFRELPDASWVLYKLDGGIDHILLDEAQDTSAEQWEIIRFLSDEFFAGEGGHETGQRTVFAVGDPKQSIYGFQGAVPEAFDRNGRTYQGSAKAVEAPFEFLDLPVSYRSAPTILNVVDKVFAAERAKSGVGDSTHVVHRTGAEGLVEIWPIELPGEAATKDIWVPFTSNVVSVDERYVLAQKIASKIRQWLDTGEMLKSKDRPIQPGDVLILLRNRKPLMDVIVEALKRANIPVAGVDRLKLTDHIAVEDVLAMLKFALLPRDDLNLAIVLKSVFLLRDDGKPFEEADLERLCIKRKNKSLWQRLNTAAEDGEPYTNACRELNQILASAPGARPFDLIADVLNAPQFAQRLNARLGSEVEEPLNALLMRAEAYEREHIADLQGFVSAIEKSDREIKRESAADGGEVRIMTVHGAKGLEENIVILPDTIKAGPKARSLTFTELASNVPVWIPKKRMATGELASAIEKDEEAQQREENRLLYVAMTRACDRLYVTGASKSDKESEDSWYTKIKSQIEREAQQIDDPVFGQILRLGGAGDSEQSTRNEAAVETADAPLPDWFKSDFVPPEKRPDRPHRPSSPSMVGQSPQNAPSPLASFENSAQERGTLIHKALQILPEREKPFREHAAQAIFARSAHPFSQSERHDMWREVDNVLSNDEFSAIFGPGSMAEVPIVATVSKNNASSVLVNGRIDRISVDATSVQLVDFKTDRIPPENPKQVKAQILQQLASYYLALEKVYPDKQISAAIIWTSTATLMALSRDVLIKHF